MALGDQYNNNNNKNKYTPTVYSQYKFSNPNSKVDATMVSFSFWNSLLKISVAARKETNDDTIAFDHENDVSIYLSHTKARILYNEILKFMEDPLQFNNVGVDSGSGLITISNGKEFGVNCPFMIFRKIDANTGNVECSFAYQFKKDYHYSIRNYQEGSSSYEKNFYDNLELEQFLELLKQYYESMTGAIAYSVIDNEKYDVSRLNTKIGSIMEKLGIENGKTKSYPSRSVFNNDNATSNGNSNGFNSGFSSSTIDDIESIS